MPQSFTHRAGRFRGYDKQIHQAALTLGQAAAREDGSRWSRRLRNCKTRVWPATRFP